VRAPQIRADRPPADTHYFLGPARGGLTLPWAEGEVTVITPTSPLGRQLLGQTIGATVTLPGRASPTRHTLVALA
jgi:hypothetical protein